MSVSTNKNRYREVLKVCLPLVISLSATTVMEFTDRVFLANYSIEAISAALPAGITSYLFIAFLGGVGGYASVFIAQYFGRGEQRKIGSVLWQSIYFTLFSGVLLYLVGAFLAEPIFRFAGHSEEIRVLEEIYFSIICKGGILHVAMMTLATFFTGRGITRPVMVITCVGVIANIPLNYALIFGKFGLPELGIQGAALATVFAWGINTILLGILIFSAKNRKRFALFSTFQFNKDIFIRLMRFGVPGSLQFTLDILAFTLFILLVGRISDTALAATNIVLSINALAFMPSFGASQGISVLVGQALGKKEPETAAIYVKNSCQMLLGYILVIDLLFIFAPDLVLMPFLSSGEAAASVEVAESCKLLLHIIAAYLFFDALYMVLSGALRGAGDTKFMMIAMAIASPIFLVIPVYVGIEFFNVSVGGAWIWVLIFIVALFAISALRYKTGKWKEMLVIEDELSR